MSSIKFPENFLWGVATSAFQTEGNPFEIEKRSSDWADWAAIGSKVTDGTTADVSCDFYNRYVSDINLAKELNLNAFRIGLNWAALCPDASYQNALNPTVIAYYKKALQHLKEQGMSTFVTLFHFCLPRWLADIGGWNNPRTIEEFERFAKTVAKELGDCVDFWLTLNEPTVYIYHGYIHGAWPPGYDHNYVQAFQAMRNMLIGHSKAYHAIKEITPNAQVSFVAHWTPFIARNNFHLLDLYVKNLRHQIANLMFLDAVKTGILKFPFPLNMNESMARLAGPIPNLDSSYDFIGINYYTREICQFKYEWPLTLFGARSKETRLETTPYGWEIYPEGLYELLTNGLKPFLIDLEGKNKPVYITENGMATLHAPHQEDGDWSLNDDLRIQYITQHLKVISDAIAHGVNVRGYLYWSLLDNFEWSDGLTPRFGLVRVAYPTQERTLRKSAQAYAEIAKSNSLPGKYMEKLIDSNKENWAKMFWES